MLWKFELCRKFLVHWGIIACIGIIAYIRMLQLCFENFELCRKLWVYWGATILIARGLLFSSRLGPGSFAFHKVIYSRLQPFTASPLEMTLWNPSGPSAAMPRAAANTVCWQMDEVFLPQFNSLVWAFCFYYMNTINFKTNARKSNFQKFIDNNNHWPKIV